MTLGARATEEVLQRFRIAIHYGKSIYFNIIGGNKKYMFGNHRDKVNNYKAFWNRENTKRPLVGFTFRSFLPFYEYKAIRKCQHSKYLTPDMIKPEEFMKDEVKLLTEGEIINDDIIRGDCAVAAVIPWLAGILGAKLRILPGSIIGEELNLSWEECKKININKQNPWFKKYIEFTKTLIKKSNGNFPVSPATFCGPSDLLCLLLGSSQSILGLIDTPGKAVELLRQLSDIFIEILQELWKIIPQFYEGYFEGEYQLWAPGHIVYLQEDAIALYSPKLYRKFIQSMDRKIASLHFPNSFSLIHLHSTSMFLLEAFLEIDEIKCYEINNDERGPEIKKMIPYFKVIQKAKKPLIIRGAFTKEDIKLLMDSLEPQGLYLYIIVQNIEEISILKRLLGML